MNILVPTDFSNDAYNALFYAAKLYRDKKCQFHIIHVCNRQSHLKAEYSIYKGEKSLKQFLCDRTDECLKETRHRIIADTDGNPLHKYTIVRIYDEFIKGVKTYMRNNPVDLLVMGNKGRTGAKEIFLGGNTIQMLKSKISCPLLCIPKEIEYKTISRMVYITDYKHAFNQRALKLIKSIAKTNAAILHILHVGDVDKQTDDQSNNKASLARFFSNTDIRFHNITRSKSIAKTVANYVETHQIDLLGMIYYPHYLLTNIFREPVVMDLSIYIEKPLLVLPDLE